MLPLPRREITSEDEALDWWENDVATFFDSVGSQVCASALVRTIVDDLRTIRKAYFDATLSLTEAADETGYSTKQVGRWVRDGKVANVGTLARPRVKRADIMSHKKALALPRRPDLRISGTAQDIARSVANSNRSGDG
jgi:hypothetical protein